ncbi:MAG: circularly permuted type 2 ATP-grasp protein [Betaproteobacteria bacterium]|nr:circularly permuted type 2 ATP-grasp protein [Betaproteobacteria bacterium]MBK7079342.1 circularly permuted type 2 ATP-grasp protein [Betaproteobacteria bacterium]
MLTAAGLARSHYLPFSGWLEKTPPARIAQKRDEAERAFHRVGITFAVYGEDGGAERLIPFDIVPRIIPADEWKLLERGLRQRVQALNLFLHDIYHEQAILKAGRLPAERVLNNAQFRPEMRGMDVPGGIYAHIAGVDVVRAGEGEYYVLEDNLRVPSGVSYMLENRKMMMRLFPELFATQSIRPVQHYPDLLLENLRTVAPSGEELPTVAVLTPGAHNSAYYEHAFLAQQMGVELVEGQDLFVQNETVYMRTTRGPQRVHVLYRRVDDDFLDPRAFRTDSMIGVPGLFAAYRAGRVTLANAIGTGVADDKSIYPYVGEMIRFYLAEEPVLNNVPTYLCHRAEDRAYVLEHLPELVVKETHGAGGYGMLVGPASTAAERETFRARILAHPDQYIAQPTLALSTCPTFVESGLAPRHIDLRPYVLSGRTVDLVPGGLTRVALREGSLVVNSSQGGGTKDTWVLAG